MTQSPSQNPPPPGSLVYAAANREWGEVEELIEVAADIDEKDYRGNTTLLHAASCGRPDIVSLLISKGADLNVGNKFGFTPLMAAIYHPDCVSLLIEAGAALDKKNLEGKTAFDYAAQLRRPTVARLLEEAADNKRLTAEKKKTLLGSVSVLQRDLRTKKIFKRPMKPK